ncbi:MAG: hypothetical protein HN757_17515, partial [Calditrichaeota bacterium]|nr:hypothetical protein [Calditrichota bacterium]
MITGVRYFLKVALARAYVRIIGAQRELSWIIGDTLLPFLSVAAYVYVYRAMNAPPEYTGFVILGGIVVTFWMHMLWSMGMQFFWEKEMGNMALYLMAPGFNFLNRWIKKLNLEEKLCKTHLIPVFHYRYNKEVFL